MLQQKLVLYCWKSLLLRIERHSFGDQTFVMVQRASSQWHSMFSRRSQCWQTPHPLMGGTDTLTLSTDWTLPVTGSPSRRDFKWSFSRWFYPCKTKPTENQNIWLSARTSKLWQRKCHTCSLVSTILHLNAILLKIVILKVVRNAVFWTVLLFSAVLNRNRVTTLQPPQGLSHGTGPQPRLTEKHTSSGSYSCVNLNVPFTIYPFWFSTSSGCSI